MNSRFVFAALFFLLPGLSRLRAETFSWPEHGSIEMTVAVGWTLTTKETGDVVFVLEGQPKAGAAILQLSLLDLPPDKPAHAADLQARLAKLMQPYLASSVEGKFAPQPVALIQGSGWYAQLTDASLVGKPPVPDNYKMMRNGLLLLDEHALVVVSMQFDDPNGRQAAAMLTMLGTLRFARSDNAETVPPAEILSVRSTGATYELSVPNSNVVLSIPTAGLVHDTPRIGGSTASPRYFQLSRAQPNLIISGWFEPDDRYKGDLKAFWAGEEAGMKKGGLPTPEGVGFSSLGNWQVVTYSITLPGQRGTNTHLRAELTQDGTWIDLHLSITSPQSIAASRAELLAVLKSIQVSAK